MTSQRNERMLQRRQALREQQRRELAAVDDFAKAEEREYAARLQTARVVTTAADDFGQARAADLLGLTSREVTTYLNEVKEADASEAAAAAATAAEEVLEEAAGSLQDATDNGEAASTAGSVPGQASEREASPAGAGV